MSPVEVFLTVLAAGVGLVFIFALARSVRIVPQQRMDVVEFLGKYRRTLSPGLNVLVPFVERVRNKVDLRERVVSFPPQPVITSDNLVVSIDTVLYFKAIDPYKATYAIADYLQGIEQLTVTTLRNVVGSLDLEKTLTSREEINRKLSAELDGTTGEWGIKVTRVEIKAIEPPSSIRDSMEKQMRAERDRRAAILNAEGVKQSQILTADGDKQGAVLRAEGDRQARILTAEGQAKAIRTVFNAIHEANPDTKVMAYQYLQALPQIAAGSANKVWIVPAELTKALEGIGVALGGLGSLTGGAATVPPEEDEPGAEAIEAARAAEEAVKAVEAEVRAAAQLVSGNEPRPAVGPAGLPAAPSVPVDTVLGETAERERERG